MFCKNVVLDIFSNRKPYELIIFDEFGRVVKEITARAHNSRICFSTRSCVLKLVANYNGQVILKRICLNNYRCQNIYIEFAFKTIISQGVLNNITLTDEVYDLPVPNAILRFEK